VTVIASRGLVSELGLKLTGRGPVGARRGRVGFARHNRRVRLFTLVLASVPLKLSRASSAANGVGGIGTCTGGSTDFLRIVYASGQPAREGGDVEIHKP